MKQEAKNYYFTVSGVPTDKEKSEAKKHNATLVNGVYGSTFHKPTLKAFGNVPEHFLDKKPKKRKPVAKSPEVKSEKEG